MDVSAIRTAEYAALSFSLNIDRLVLCFTAGTSEADDRSRELRVVQKSPSDSPGPGWGFFILYLVF